MNKIYKQILVVVIMLIGLVSSAQVGINTDGSDPDSSSMLDVKSNDKGFLPPRMTMQDRENITSPAKGLMIYCIDCGVSGGEPQYYNGTTWVNMIGGPALESSAIGDFAYGGVVFYLDGNGGGLVCAVSDQDGGSGIQWSNGVYTVTGAIATAIGTGQANTTTIITNQGAGSYAATACTDYGDGNWFLPSKDEQSEMYLNKAVIDSTATANGGTAFVSDYYWSSSEELIITAWARNFDYGGPGNLAKDFLYRVRGVRAF